ncbi:hypothetical protein [Paludisphaera sp.]|uniref:hypothetical protein n=1 Tax=Paludisphaera sp. TaxID=2017432 RepID=UPI00301D8DCB
MHTEPKGKPDAARRRACLRFRIRRENRFLDDVVRTLDPVDALAWWMLRRDTQPDGLARPGRDHLAERLGVGGDRAAKAIRVLTDMKAARLVYAHRPGMVAVYTVLTPGQLAAINPEAARVVAEREAAETPDERDERRARVDSYLAKVARRREARSKRGRESSLAKNGARRSSTVGSPTSIAGEPTAEVTSVS